MKLKPKKIIGVLLRPAVVWTLLGAFFTFYLAVHLVRDFSPTVDTAVAVEYSYDSVVSGEAYILRNEQLLTTLGTGYIDYKLENGEYAKAGAVIAVRYGTPDTEEVRAICDRLDELNGRIDFLGEYSYRLGAGGISSTLASVEEDYTAYTAALSVGDTATAMKYADTFAGRLFTLEENEGREVDEKLAATKAELTALTAEREELYARLSVYPSETVTAPTTGNFFRGTDGLEYVCAATEVESLTLSELLETSAAVPSASSDTAIGRFIADPTWYLAFPTTMVEAERLSVGSSYEVAFAGASDGTLDMTLERIVSEGTDTRAMLVFSSAAMPEGFGVARRRSVTVTVRTYSGYRVPAAAISTDRNGTGVWILSSGVASRRQAEVVLDLGSYCIVEPAVGDGAKDLLQIAKNDIVLVTDEKLYEGKLID